MLLSGDVLPEFCGDESRDVAGIRRSNNDIFVLIAQGRRLSSQDDIGVQRIIARRGTPSPPSIRPKRRCPQHAV